MANPKRRHSKSRTAKRRTHHSPRPDHARRVPTVSRAETVPSGLSALRVLSGSPGPVGQGRLVACLREIDSRFRLAVRDWQGAMSERTGSSRHGSDAVQVECPARKAL